MTGLPLHGAPDISGRGVDKPLKRLRKSGPALFEWFSSPIVCRTAFAARFPSAARRCFSSRRRINVPGPGHTEEQITFRGGPHMVIGVIRTVILYLLIIAGVRLMGKRQVGELEPSELVLDLIIADLAAVPMQDFGIPLLSGILPIFTLLCVTMMLSVLTMKSVRFRAVLCGRPSIIIENGRINQREMRKNRFTVDELSEELRGQGVTDFAAVKYAILETNGRVSVLPFAGEKPPTARQLNLPASDGGLPMVLINDGRLLERHLRQRGFDRVWLEKRLAEHGVRSPREVYLLSVDEQGQVYFVPKEAVGR